MFEFTDGQIADIAGHAGVAVEEAERIVDVIRIRYPYNCGVLTVPAIPPAPELPDPDPTGRRPTDPTMGQRILIAERASRMYAELMPVVHQRIGARITPGIVLAVWRSAEDLGAFDGLDNGQAPAPVES